MEIHLIQIVSLCLTIAIRQLAVIAKSFVLILYGKIKKHLESMNLKFRYIKYFIIISTFLLAIQDQRIYL